MCWRGRIELSSEQGQRPTNSFGDFRTIVIAFGSSAEAQQPTKVSRIGSLSGQSPSTSPARREAFRQGLRELGYIEGKSIVIEWRYAEGKFDRLPALAAELVRLKVDVIVTGGPQQPVLPSKQLPRFPL